MGPEGSGPPPHSHPWDESFYVFKGEIAFGFDATDTVAGPGTLVHIPAGTTHWFRFGKGGCEMVSMTSREGASRLFADFDREISPEEPDLGKLIEIAIPALIDSFITFDIDVAYKDEADFRAKVVNKPVLLSIVNNEGTTSSGEKAVFNNVEKAWASAMPQLDTAELMALLGSVTVHDGENVPL